MARDIWEQQPNEPDKSFLKFKLYRDMGPTRTVLAAYRLQTGRPDAKQASGDWNRDRVDYDWANRAREYDRWIAGKLEPHLRGVATEAREEIRDVARAEATAAAMQVMGDMWADRRASSRSTEWEMAQALFDKARAMLKVALINREEGVSPDGRKILIFNPAKWSFFTITQIVETAAKLQRLACEMPPSIAELPAPKMERPEESMFQTTGQIIDVMPNGVVPEMPDDSAVKPDLSHAAGQGTGQLTIPVMVRPSPRVR